MVTKEGLATYTRGKHKISRLNVFISRFVGEDNSRAVVI